MNNNVTLELLKECLLFLNKFELAQEARDLKFKIATHLDEDNYIFVEDMSAPCPSYCPGCTGNGETHSKVFKRVRKPGSPLAPII